MKYVYLVYEDSHGLVCVCGTPEKATELVKKDAYEFGIPEGTPPDCDWEHRWGWDGATWWVRREVIE